MTGVELQHFIDGLNSYGKQDYLTWGYDCSLVRVIIGTTVMNDIWENMD